MTTQRAIYQCLVDIASRLRRLERLALEADKKTLQKSLASKADALEAEAARLRKALRQDWTRGTAAVLKGLTRARGDIEKALKSAAQDDKVFRGAARLAAAAARALALAKKAVSR